MRVRLVSDAETESAAPGGRDSAALGLADHDGAFVGGEETAGYPEQCRLPGPVLPDEGVDLACAAVDADLTKRLYRTERLGHAPKREDGARGGNVVSPASRPGTRHRFDRSVPVSSYGATGLVGYIFLNRLLETRDVADASSG